MADMKVYYTGENPRLRLELKNPETGALEDCDGTVTISITDSRGKARVEYASSTGKVGTGIYYYQGYSIESGSPTGVWEYEWIATNASGHKAFYRGAFRHERRV